MGQLDKPISHANTSHTPSITLKNCTDIVISASELRSIKLENCERIAIRNCWIHDSDRIAVDVYRSRHISVEGCRIEKVVTGVYAMR